MAEQQHDRRRVLPLVLAVLAVAMGVMVVAAGGLASVAWWVLEPDRSSPTAEAVQGASTDADDDAGFSVWSRNDDGTPVRWDPCTPVELVVATDGAPSGFVDDLEVAVRRVNAATGLDLVIAGETEERPAISRVPYQPERYGQRWAPVLVAWASPDDPGTPLRDIDRGVATPIAVGPAGDRTYVTGQVVFNRDRDELVSGFEDRATSWGATILHELGHLVGLGHVDDPDELMATHPGTGPVRFGPGDLEGLVAVGASNGCRDRPAAQPVEVEPPEP